MNSPSDSIIYLHARRRALLEITVSHFNSTNRALSSMGCEYSHSTFGGCAIGRLLPAPIADSLPQSSWTRIARDRPGKFDYLDSAYGHEFLQALQNLHDTPNNWTPTGLSPLGHETYLSIISTFCTH